MLKACAYCGKVFDTEYPGKKYCDKKCANNAAKYRDESFYVYPKESETPLFEFDCAECGKHVSIYSRYDQRNRYCCGICAEKAKKRRAAQHRSKHRPTNIGMSGGMSLKSLIRRESRSADKEKVIELKICPVCGKKFEVTGRNKKYCSVECQLRVKVRGR